MIIGKRFFSCRATCPLATTRKETVVSHSHPTPMRSARQVPIMGLSSRTAAARSWKSTTSIPFERTASFKLLLRLHDFLKLVTYDLALSGARDLGDQLNRVGHFVARQVHTAMGDQRLILDRLARPRYHK